MGSSLARAALTAFLRSAEEIARRGTFGCARDALGRAALNAIFAPRPHTWERRLPARGVPVVFHASSSPNGTQGT